MLVLQLVWASPALCQGGTPADRAQAIDYETARLSRVATAVRITEEMTIDGRLDESGWRMADPVGDFTQRRPRHGEPATERTEVRFLYDDNNLYVGVICFDSDPEIIVNSLQKDYQTQESDGVTLLIDSLHDRRSGFTFVTNPGGAKRDVQISNDETGNADWDGVWDVKTTITAEGWIAEYVIPFKTLRFSSSPSQEWGLQITRRIVRKSEEADWAPIPLRYGNFRMSLAGTLRGLENIRQGRNLKVKPFVSGAMTQSRALIAPAPASQGLTRLDDFDGGFDVKYGLTPSLTLDATFRTDFAQVEVDQQQVNLTRFNQFFPEKRDFFLENTGTFTFGPGGNLVPFFSRRIGLSAAGTPIPIIGGGRVSGKLDRYDVGVLAMKTERLDATPSNNFLVGRVKRNLLRNSWVGTLVTHRDSTLASDHNRVFGADAHFEFFQKLELDTYVLGSDTPGRSGKNLAKRLQTGWRDEEFEASAEYNEVEPDFNPEVGFIRRRDMEQYAGEATWQPMLERSAVIRNFVIGSRFDYFEGSGSGTLETRSSETTLGVLFESNASMNFIVNHTFDRLDSPLRIPAGNPRVTLDAGDYEFSNFTGNFSTNQRRRISGNGAYNWGDFYGGNHKQVTAGLNLKPNQHLTVNLTYDRNRVTLPGGAFTTELVGARFIYGFTPRAFFNAFIQYNANTQLLSSTLRFDLIHRPLSDLYIVYNDTRDTGTQLLRERAFIVKLTNLFDF
jgi:hypothetical protein